MPMCDNKLSTNYVIYLFLLPYELWQGSVWKSYANHSTFQETEVAGVTEITEITEVAVEVTGDVAEIAEEI